MPVRYVLNRVKRFFIYRVLHVDDTPHRIALGLAVGIFITWTPTIGLQMVLTVAVSALLGANKVVGVPFVWISNPATLGPIYVPNYLLGCLLLRQRPIDIAALFATLETKGWLSFLKGLWDAGVNVFVSLWVGSILVGLVLAVPTYFLTRYAVVRYRIHWHRKHDAPPSPGPDGEEKIERDERPDRAPEAQGSESPGTDAQGPTDL